MPENTKVKDSNQLSKTKKKEMYFTKVKKQFNTLLLKSCDNQKKERKAGKTKTRNTVTTALLPLHGTCKYQKPQLKRKLWVRTCKNTRPSARTHQPAIAGESALKRHEQKENKNKNY